MDGKCPALVVPLNSSVWSFICHEAGWTLEVGVAQILASPWTFAVLNFFSFLTATKSICRSITRYPFASTLEQFHNGAYQCVDGRIPLLMATVS